MIICFSEILLVYQWLSRCFSNPCDFNGMDVVVLFTSFGGSDAHEILLESAIARNMSVYFGMPQIPRTWEFGDIDRELLPSYFEWGQTNSWRSQI